MKRDPYAEVSARILAELERGATPWVKPGRAKRVAECGDQPAILGDISTRIR